MPINVYIMFNTFSKEYTCSYIIDDVETTCTEQDLFNCVWSVMRDLRNQKNTDRLLYTRSDIKMMRIDDYYNYAWEYDTDKFLESIF